MRTATTAFANLVAKSHTVATRVDILFDREVITEGVKLSAGTIEWNRRALHLARLDCTLLDTTRTPGSSTDTLTPYGYELRIWRGISIAGTDELLPLGTFPIQRSETSASTPEIRVAAVDRSQLVSDARFEDDYQIASGTNYADAIEDLIADGVDGLEYLFPSTTYTTPTLTFAAQEDRWQAAQKMARSIGNDIYFDGLGRCVMQSEPTFDDEAVVTIADAVNLVDAAFDLDRATAYNRVIAYGLNSSLTAQYRGVATDDDASSPSYYYGPFGKKPRFYASEFIASQAQADSAAAAVLVSGLGVAKSIRFGAVPDPRIEVGDVVQVTNAELGVDALHILDELRLGLEPGGAMVGRSRAQEGVATSE